MKHLVSADWHLRPDTPRCRLDKEWSDTLSGMIKYIVAFGKKEGAALFNIGDFFNASQQPAWIVNLFLSLVPDGVLFAGNHDFKYRNLNEIENSSVGHLLKNPKYTACIPEFEDGFYQYSDEIMLCHRLVYKPENKNLAKFKKGTAADQLIEQAREINPKVKWIYIGDNHHHFHYEEDGIHVVNPGSPLVYSGGMIGESCGFYMVDTEKETVTFHEVPDDKSLMTDVYLREEEKRTEDLQAIVSKLEDTEVESFDFFEICDRDIKDFDDKARDLHEDIKAEAIAIKTKTGKGA